MDKIIGVYKITSPSGRIYVGSTSDFKKRVTHYKRLDCRGQIKLYNSFKKYGVDSHKIELIEVCDKGSLFKLERYYGDLYNCIEYGLNLCLPGYDDIPAIYSEESVAKRSKSQSGTGNNFYGKKHTKESILKMKLSQLNKSVETIEKMRMAQLGKTVSSDVRLKMSLSQKGRTHNVGTKIKMRVNNNNLKYILCLQTGIFYEGTADAAFSHSMNRHTLKNKLNGQKINNTSLVYV